MILQNNRRYPFRSQFSKYLFCFDDQSEPQPLTPKTRMHGESVDIAPPSVKRSDDRPGDRVLVNGKNKCCIVTTCHPTDVVYGIGHTGGSFGGPPQLQN